MHATTLPAMHGAAASATRARRWLAARRHDAMVVLALGVGAGMMHASVTLYWFIDDDVSLGIAGNLLAHLLTHFLIGVVFASAALWIERLRLTGWRHAAALLVAVVALSAAFTVKIWIEPWHIPALVERGGVAPSTIAVAQFWHGLLIGTLVFAYFVRRRVQDESAEGLAAVQAEQRAAAQRVAEARLKSLTARVDPRLLFDLLDSVQRAYAVDPPRAERLLDELIVFLRAALSRLHRASSTIAQECEVAASYARLLNLAGTSRATLSMAGPAAQTRFPPGVILPLVEDLLRDGGDDRLSISTALSAERCEVRIVAARAPMAAALAHARDMLQRQDDDSAIDVMHRAGDVVTTLKVVCRSVAATDSAAWPLIAAS